MPELITVCWADGKPYQAIYGIQGEMEIFDPSEPRVYTTMEALLQEVKERFPSNYIHLGRWIDHVLIVKSFLNYYHILSGMDEVYDKCW